MNNKPQFDWSNLERDYKDLGSIIKVADKYGCSPAAVHYRLKQNKIGRVKNKFSKVEIENVVELYEKHGSTEKVAKAVGVSRNTVIERLKEKGVKFNHDNKSVSTSVGLGRIGEKIALKYLEKDNVIDVTRNKIHHPYDLSWEGKKVDAKVSRPNRKNKNKWYFNTSAPHKSDFYFCIGLDERDNIEKMFIFPREVLPKGVLGINRTKSMNDKYSLEVNDDEIKELNGIIQSAKEF